MPRRTGPYPKATDRQGQLNEIKDCSLVIPGTQFSGGGIRFHTLPIISDSKGAKWNDDPVMGRATPLTTYSHSDIRIITVDIPLIATNDGSAITPGSFLYNKAILKAIESAAYPRGPTAGFPYVPPPICKFRCGQLLTGTQAGDKESLCVVLDNYNVKFDTNVPFDPATLIPFKFNISTKWRVVYQSDYLPNQNRIWKIGK